MPVGPSALWAEKARKSHPSACTSVARWGTDCAASIITGAPAAWAASTISRTGLTVPREFATWVMDTKRVRGPSIARYSSITSAPSSSMGTTRSFAPVCSQRSCHGTMFEWCSMWEMTISSPSRSRGRTNPLATRLMASVVPRAKTISRGSPALRKARTFSRVPS